MQEKRNEGKEGRREGVMKKRRDSGVIHEWKDSELEGYMKGVIQD